MSMFGGGGGGTNLPPLIQRLNIVVSGQNAAVNALNAARQASGSAVTGMSNLTGASNMASQAFLGQQVRARMMADSLRQVGSLMQYTIVMPLINVGMQAIRTSLQFEDAMVKIRGLVGATSADMKMFEESVLSLAGEVGKSPVELADALYYVTSAGFEGKKAMDVVEASAKAAAAGLGETATIADTLTSVLNAYSKSGYEATDVTDMLVAAVREGKAEPEDMAGAMGKIVPVSSQFGVAFEDVAAAIASMTRQGAVASTAAIYLRQVLNTLLDPTEKAKTKLLEVGMSATTLRKTIQEDGLYSGLSQLYNAFNGNADAIATVFGNVRAMTAVFSLMGENADANRQIFDELHASTGDTDTALKEMQKTAGFQMKQAAGDLGEAMVRLGQSLFPLVRIAATVGKGLANAFSFIMGNRITQSIVLVVGALSTLGLAFVSIMRVATSFYRMKLLFTTIFRGMAGGVIDNFKTFAMLQNQMGSYYQAQMMGMQATVNATAASNAQTTVNIKQSMSERELITALISKNETNATNIALMHMATNASTQHGTAAALDSDAILAQARSMGIASGQAVGLSAAMRGLMFASVGLGVAFMAWPLISGWFKGANKEMSTTQEILNGINEIGGYKLKAFTFDQSIEIAATIDTGPSIQEELEKKLDEDIEGVDYTLREKIKSVNSKLGSDRQAKIDWASSFMSFNLGDTDPKLKAEIAKFLASAFNINASEIKTNIEDPVAAIADAIDASLNELGNAAASGTEKVDFDTGTSYWVANFTNAARKALGEIGSIPMEQDSVKGFKDFFDQIMIQMSQSNIDTDSYAVTLADIMKNALKVVTGEDLEGTTIIEVLQNALDKGGGKIPDNMRNIFNAFLNLSDAEKDAINLGNGYQGVLKRLADEQDKAADKTLALATVAERLGKEFDTNNGYFEDAINQMDAVDAAMEKVQKQQESMTKGTTNYIEAGIDARDAIRGMIEAVDESGGRLLDGTKITDEALGTVMEAATAARDAATALFASDPSDPAAAIDVYTDSITNLFNTLRDKGVSEEEIKRITDSGGILSIQAFGESLQGGTGIYADAIQTALTNAYGQAKPALSGLGEDITYGILYGMTHASSTEMRYQTTLLMNELVGLSQEVLGIKSPSTVFAELVGVPITEGIAQGILDAADQQDNVIKEAIDTLIGSATDAISGVSDAISGQLDFAQAVADLAKFRNEMKLFAGQQEDANAAVDEARFKFGGGTKVTAYERSQLDDLYKQQEEARRAYQMGTGSYAAFIDAQYAYKNAVRDSKQPSEELVDAQNGVIDANYNVNTASLQLMDAQNGVASAFLDMVEAATTLAVQGQKARDTFNAIAAAAGLTKSAIASIIGQAYILAGPRLFGNLQLGDIFPGVDFGNLPSRPTGGGGSGGGGGGGGGNDDEPNPPGGPPVLPKSFRASVAPELFINRTTAKVGNKTALNAVTRTSVPAGYDGTMNNTNNFNITVNNPTPEPASDSIVRRASAAVNAGQFG